MSKSPLEADIETHLALGGRPSDARALLERASGELRGLRETIDLLKRLVDAADLPAELHEHVSAEWLRDTAPDLAEEAAPPDPILRIVPPTPTAE